MVADAAFDSQAERAKLAGSVAVRIAPATGKALAAAGGHSERGRRLDHRLLERAHERPEQHAAVGELDDRVCDELARAVVRDLAATLDADQLDAPSGSCSGDAHVFLIRLAPERQHRRMLEHQQLVAGLPLRRAARQGRAGAATRRGTRRGRARSLRSDRSWPFGHLRNEGEGARLHALHDSRQAR